MSIFKTVIDVSGVYLQGSIEPVTEDATMARGGKTEYRFLGSVGVDKEVWTELQLKDLEAEIAQVRDKLNELNGPRQPRSSIGDPLWK